MGTDLSGHGIPAGLLGTWTGTRTDAKDGTSFPITVNVRSILGGAGFIEEMEVHHLSSTYRGVGVSTRHAARNVWQMQYANNVSGRFVAMEAEIDDDQVRWRPVARDQPRDSKLVYEHPDARTWIRTQYSTESESGSPAIIFVDRLTRAD